MIANPDSFTAIPSRKSIKAKYVAMARAKRWSITVVTDEAIKALAERESVALPDEAEPTTSTN